MDNNNNQNNPMDADGKPPANDGNLPDNNGQNAGAAAGSFVKQTDYELKTWLRRHASDAAFEEFMMDLYRFEHIPVLPEHKALFKMGMEQIKDCAALPTSKNIGPGIGYTWSRQIRYETTHLHNPTAIDTDVYPPMKWLNPLADFQDAFDDDEVSFFLFFLCAFFLLVVSGSN
jgi:hypothetical protein